MWAFWTGSHFYWEQPRGRYPRWRAYVRNYRRNKPGQRQYQYKRLPGADPTWVRSIDSDHYPGWFRIVLDGYDPTQHWQP